AVGRRGGGDERRDVQVAVRGRRRPEANGTVGEPHMQRVGVRRRVDRDSFTAELVERTNDAHRDLTAVRYEDTPEHGSSLRVPAPDQTASSGRPTRGSSSNRTWPNSTGAAFSTRIVRTTASISAFTSFISFIASRMQSVWPGATTSPSSTNGGE